MVPILADVSPGAACRVVTPVRRARSCWWVRLAAALALAAGTPPAARAVLRETRGVWITGDWLESPDRIREAVSVARQLRANALFVQVRRRGDAYYRSTLAPVGPREEGTEPEFDPLAAVLQEARERELAVHAWLNMFYVWSEKGLPTGEGHSLTEHPAWVLRDSRGAPLSGYAPEELEGAGYDGLYLEPGNSTVRHHLRQIVRELLTKYRVDGVHLDYVRYPTLHCGYTAEARDMIRAVAGRDVGSASRLRSTDREAVVWKAWRAEQVSSLVRGISRDVSAIQPTVCVTASVVPDPTLSYEHYGQDWVGWLNEGLVGAVVTMTYSPDDELVRSQVAAGRHLTGPGGLYVGLGVFNLPCQQLISRIEMARDVGCDGVVLYGMDQLSRDPAYRYGLSLGPFREPAVAHRCKLTGLPAFRPPRSPWRLPQGVVSAVALPPEP